MALPPKKRLHSGEAPTTLRRPSPGAPPSEDPTTLRRPSPDVAPSLARLFSKLPADLQTEILKNCDVFDVFAIIDVTRQTMREEEADRDAGLAMRRLSARWLTASNLWKAAAHGSLWQRFGAAVWQDVDLQVERPCRSLKDFWNPKHLHGLLYENVVLVDNSYSMTAGRIAQVEAGLTTLAELHRTYRSEPLRVCSLHDATDDWLDGGAAVAALLRDKLFCDGKGRSDSPIGAAITNQLASYQQRQQLAHAHNSAKRRQTSNRPPIQPLTLTVITDGMANDFRMSPGALARLAEPWKEQCRTQGWGDHQVEIQLHLVHDATAPYCFSTPADQLWGNLSTAVQDSADAPPLALKLMDPMATASVMSLEKRLLAGVLRRGRCASFRAPSDSPLYWRDQPMPWRRNATG